MVIFSRHARRQMKWRNISESEVNAVINEPEEETPSVKGRVNLWGETKTGRLKITAALQGKNIIVVTVIRKERK